MIEISVQQLCHAVQGVLKIGYQTLAQCGTKTINNVSTDTRTIQKNDLFIALKGPTFDAHDLLQAAIDKGAAVLLVEESSDIDVANDNIVIEVADTRIALGLLAKYVRLQISGLKCAAITGSNGKTTCKELLSAILAVHAGTADKVLATSGNFNNDIGLPLTLLRLQHQHQFSVLELGANHIGEIAYTSALAIPHVALVNNVMPAHLEGFGSLEGVARAKSEIWSNLAPSGIAVVNLDAKFAEQFIAKLQKDKLQYICFSRTQQANSQDAGSLLQADLFASDISCDTAGLASFTLNVNQVNPLDKALLSLNADDKAVQQVKIKLTIPGLHNVSNALAVCSMALVLGCSLEDVQQGLTTVEQVKGRLNATEINEHLTVIDDTYNANSASVRAGIDLLTQYPHKTILVCGDMGELGDYAEQEHRTIGEYAQQNHIDELFTVGSLSEFVTNAYNALSKNRRAKHFSDKEQLKFAINSYLDSTKSKVVVLVKGSRSTRMEEIVAFIKEKYNV